MAYCASLSLTSKNAPFDAACKGRIARERNVTVQKCAHFWFFKNVTKRPVARNCCNFQIFLCKLL